MSLGSPYSGRQPIGRPPVYRPVRSVNNSNSEYLHADYGAQHVHRNYISSQSQAGYTNSLSNQQVSYTAGLSTNQSTRFPLSPSVTRRNVDNYQWATTENGINLSQGAPDEFETFGSVSTKISEEMERKKILTPLKTSNFNNNNVEESQREVISTREIDECSAFNSTAASEKSVSAETLMNIRSEMSKALRKLRELEIQVASIPGLRSQISYLTEENKRLRDERHKLKSQIENMEEQDEFVEKQVVEEVTRLQRPNVQTPNVIVHPTPTLPAPTKPEMCSKAVGTVTTPKSFKETGVGDWNVEEEIEPQTESKQTKPHIHDHRQESIIVSETSIATQTPGNMLINDFSVGNIQMQAVSTMTTPIPTRTVGFNPPKSVLNKNIGIWCRLDVENNIPSIEEPVEDEVITKKSVTVKSSATTKSSSKQSEFNQNVTSPTVTRLDSFDANTQANEEDENRWTESRIINYLDSLDTSAEHQKYYSSLISKLILTYKTNKAEFVRLLVELLAKKVKSVAILVHPETRAIACETLSTKVRSVGVGDDIIDVIVRPQTIQFDRGVSIRPDMIHKYSSPDKSYYSSRGMNTDMREVYDRGILTRQIKTDKASETQAATNREVGVMKSSGYSDRSYPITEDIGINIAIEEEVPYTMETWATEGKLLGSKIIDEKEIFRTKEIRMTKVPIQSREEEITPIKTVDLNSPNRNSDIIEETVFPEKAKILYNEDKSDLDVQNIVIEEPDDYDVATRTTYVEEGDNSVRHVTEEHHRSKNTSEIPQSDAHFISHVDNTPYALSTVTTREESVITSEEKRVSRKSRSGSIGEQTSANTSANEPETDFVLSSPLKRQPFNQLSAGRKGSGQSGGDNISINIEGHAEHSSKNSSASGHSGGQGFSYGRGSSDVHRSSSGHSGGQGFSYVGSSDVHRSSSGHSGGQGFSYVGGSSDVHRSSLSGHSGGQGFSYVGSSDVHRMSSGHSGGQGFSYVGSSDVHRSSSGHSGGQGFSYVGGSSSGHSGSYGFSGRRVALSESLESACVVLSQWLQDSTRQSAREIKLRGSQENAAMNVIKQEWLSLFTSEEFDYLHIEGFISSITAYGQGITDRMINMYDSSTGNTAMHFAVQYGYWSVIGLLLRSGKVDLTQCNKLDQTPLSLLNKKKLVDISLQDRQTIMELYKQTSNQFAAAISAAEEKGEEDISIETPIISAVTSGNIELLETLFKLGVSVNDRDPRGRTALMTATITGNISMVKMLLSHEDIDTLLVDDEGNSATQLALDRNHDQIAYLIRSRENSHKTNRSSRK